MALVNNLSAAGDAFIAVALAGSVFVSVPLHAARGRTAIGLVCTMLPFAVVAPLVGPLTDRVRRGKRFVVFLAAIGRMAAVVMMSLWLDNLLLFPAAFLALVCSKSHTIARAALVPTVVCGESELVPANAKLAVGGGVTSALAAGLGSLVYGAFDAKAVLDAALVVLAFLTIFSLDLPSPPATAQSGVQDEEARDKTHIAPIKRAALAVAGIRAMAGFMTALVVFGFRTQGAPVVWYGLVAVGGVAGSLAGAALAPFARRHVRSNRWLVVLGCLVIGGTAVLVTQLSDTHHRLGAFLLATIAGLAGSVAKTAFDAIVQSQIPEAHRVKTFAWLEASFQTAWVIAALAPTLISTSLTFGFAVVATVMIVLGVTLVAPGAKHLQRAM